MIQTEKKQPIKEISHQDIYAVYAVWEQLQSWQEVLPVLENFLRIKIDPEEQILMLKQTVGMLR